MSDGREILGIDGEREREREREKWKIHEDTIDKSRTTERYNRDKEIENKERESKCGEESNNRQTEI